MPNEKTLARRQELAAVATQIDEIASGVALYGKDGGLAHQLAVAQAIVDMRALLTPEVMVPVMALMNTGLGFKTDRDPARPPRSGPAPTAYSVEVVREVVIEAKLRGFNLVGQEFNIIAGNFYACKNGLSRKVRDLAKYGVSKFRDFYDMPAISPDGQTARVKCRASWERNGEPDKAEFEFFIKLHGMGADAALGKAERRLAKEVLKFLTGDAPPEGEVEDTPAADAAPADAKPAEPAPRMRRVAAPKKDAGDDQVPGAETPARNSTTTPSNEAPQIGGEREPEVAGGGNGAAEPQAETQAQTVPPPMVATDVVPSGPPTMTVPQQAMQDLLTQHRISFDDFTDWLTTTGRAKGAKDWGAVTDIPDDVINGVMTDKKSVQRLVTIYGS